MTNQEKHLEENKEHSKISEDYPNSVSVQNPPKENSLHSILLSVTFYLSIIYLSCIVCLLLCTLGLWLGICRFDFPWSKLIKSCDWGLSNSTRDEEGE